MTDEQRKRVHDITYSTQDREELAERIVALEAENAKLRELIRKAWRLEKNGCHECPLEEECTVRCVYDVDCGMVVEIEKGLQELGAVVD